MAKLTIKQFIRKQKNKINKIRKSNTPLFLAASSAHAEQIERIFTKGGNSSGGKIGSYDTSNPIYVNPKTAPKSFQPKGKTGKAAFASGKAHKTGYFTSYKAFRSQQGRPTGTVVLLLTGQLKSDFSRAPKRVTVNKYTVGVANQANNDKVDGAESKYGRIFALTIKERKLFTDIARKEFLKIMTA